MERLFISSWLQCTLFILATYRLTRLLVFDQITNPIRKLFIEEIEIEGSKEIYLKIKSGIVRNFFGELLSCYWCTGIWCSLFFICLYWWNERIADILIAIFAVAGASAFIETITLRLMRD